MAPCTKHHSMRLRLEAMEGVRPVETVSPAWAKDSVNYSQAMRELRYIFVAFVCSDICAHAPLCMSVCMFWEQNSPWVPISNPGLRWVTLQRPRKTTSDLVHDGALPWADSKHLRGVALMYEAPRRYDTSTYVQKKRGTGVQKAQHQSAA